MKIQSEQKIFIINFDVRWVTNKFTVIVDCFDIFKLFALNIKTVSFAMLFRLTC